MSTFAFPERRPASVYYQPGNQIALLQSGVEYFPALLAAIRAARQEIHLETYIFADDEAGRDVVDALAESAQRGVAVHVLVDGFGAPDFADGLGEDVRKAGAEVLVFRPELARLQFSRRRLRRLHRKLVVIDGSVAFIGGINVIDDYDMGRTPTQIPPRFDYAVRIDGPLVAQIHSSMRHVWRLVRWATLGRRPPPPKPLRCDDAAMNKGTVSARFVERDNLRYRHAIEEAYLSAIADARDEIIIANAYFLPGRLFRRALETAVRRGVTVTLLLQGRVEYALLHYATLGLYRVLLRRGIRVIEYRASFLHAKVAVIDGQWATVGSSNIDPFSLLFAREANVVVRDAGFAGQLRDSLLQAIANGGVEIRRRDVKGWSWWLQLKSRIAFAVIRLLLKIGIGEPAPRRQA